MQHNKPRASYPAAADPVAVPMLVPVSCPDDSSSAAGPAYFSIKLVHITIQGLDDLVKHGVLKAAVIQGCLTCLRQRGLKINIVTDSNDSSQPGFVNLCA